MPAAMYVAQRYVRNINESTAARCVTAEKEALEMKEMKVMTRSAKACQSARARSSEHLQAVRVFPLRRQYRLLHR